MEDKNDRLEQEIRKKYCPKLQKGDKDGFDEINTTQNTTSINQEPAPPLQQQQQQVFQSQCPATRLLSSTSPPRQTWY